MPTCSTWCGSTSRARTSGADPARRGPRLEGGHKVRFALDVLPTVLELTRRYQRGPAFPGKAARLLGQLAVKSPAAKSPRETAMGEFHVKSGLELRLPTSGPSSSAGRSSPACARQVIGQQAAVEAMADVVAIAKARLNDPGRPLGSLLFLGPTGVGKTQCAKALAQYLFGDRPGCPVRHERVCLAAAVARLVGTFDQPEGLLTGAMRRQPFAWSCFDEIEKAHPDVFDMLLQVLGEGRLTDALGRTADFSNAVLILTSNLGTREAAGELGFDAAASAADRVYLRAVEEFFRPEFVNRLDAIVPFARLLRDETARIADMLLRDIFAREGFSRRKFALDIEQAALEGVISRGYHPSLGRGRCGGPSKRNWFTRWPRTGGHDARDADGAARRLPRRGNYGRGHVAGRGRRAARVRSARLPREPG